MNDLPDPGLDIPFRVPSPRFWSLVEAQAAAMTFAAPRLADRGAEGADD
jgi:hypothetical protein